LGWGGYGVFAAGRRFKDGVSGRVRPFGPARRHCSRHRPNRTSHSALPRRARAGGLERAPDGQALLITKPVGGRSYQNPREFRIRPGQVRYSRVRIHRSFPAHQVPAVAVPFSAGARIRRVAATERRRREGGQPSEISNPAMEMRRSMRKRALPITTGNSVPAAAGGASG
jgi:hypothetical protein